MANFKSLINYLVFSISVFGIAVFLGFASVNIAQAQAEVQVQDQKSIWTQVKEWAWDKAERVAEKAYDIGAAEAFVAALNSAVTTIAYDTATYIGSGGRGQEPLYIKEGWSTYLSNIGDNAAGKFIEELGRNEDFFGRFNLCEPDPGLKYKIGLGLISQTRPGDPVCTFSEMKENWEEALSRESFMGMAQNMFDISPTDLGASLTIYTGIVERVEQDRYTAERDREEGDGWLDIRNIAGDRLSVPGEAERRREEAGESALKLLAMDTGDGFISAANVFLNQLVVSLFHNLMSRLGDDVDRFTSPYSGDFGGLDDYEADPTSGRSDYDERIRQIKRPDFTVRGDYQVLFELSTCPDPNNPGPTNCVISDRFRDAISNRLTLAEALEQGYLNEDGVFGFLSGDLEPRYDEAYPYRSMIILRKFRIIPVGWELAAQYIRDNFDSPDVDGAKSIGQMMECFDSEDEYEGYDEEWCRGLVDPDWVFKAPQNYCAREGPGPTIMSKQVIGEGEDSQLNINRNDKYCADEQTCIQEGHEGGCEYYGYCSKDKRTWQFDSPSCNPIFNTCQSFSSPDGGKISFLENTLDYADCDSSTAGCSEYAFTHQGIDYDVEINSINWEDSDDGNYFNRYLEECDPADEGCQEFIRTQPHLGVNLLVNSDFQRDLELGSWHELGTTSEESYIGNTSLRLDQGSGQYTQVVGPADFSLRGQTYSLSLRSNNCGSNDIFNIADQATSSMEAPSYDWQPHSLTQVFEDDPTLGNEIVINFNISSANCRIDAVKLERGDRATRYTDYRERGVIVEKFLPDYLEDECYIDPGNDHRFQDDAPSICYNYARKCNQDEVGCQLYTSIRDGYEVAAQTIAQNYCPSVCDGFDTYLQRETYFDSSRFEYFIPERSDICSARAVGCDEFTNLDKIGSGAEEKEYYSQLRRCVDPNDPGIDCRTFYIWEGDEEEGRQLRSFDLEVDANGEPAYISEGDCEHIFNLDPTDPDYDPRCREFRDQELNVYYRFVYDTISCTENCHPYRRSKKNIDEDLDGGSCSAAGSGYENVEDEQFHWDGDDCYYCKNGGVWDDQHNACIYMAVPGEGISCSARDAGCREYNGNQGNNTRILYTYGFESEYEAEDWTGGSLSETSPIFGEKSLRVNAGQAINELPTLPERGNSYSLRFLARSGSGTTTLNIYFEDNEEFGFEQVEISEGEWRVYETNLESLDYDLDDPDPERLILERVSGNHYFIDNFRLTEIRNRYYLIKNSWQVPEVCNQDIYGNDHELYMLGCQAYQTGRGQTEYIHEFDQLCQDSAVGCELMINTHNYSGSEGTNVNGIAVPPDEYLYAVYSEDKRCNASEKGCERMGELWTYGTSSGRLYSDVYVKNDPDKYPEMTCPQDAVGCEAWTSEHYGESYFKDPGDRVCEWRQDDDYNWDWYQKPVSRCADSDDICKSHTDCEYLEGLGECSEDVDCGGDRSCVGGRCYESCQKEEGDTPCETDLGRGDHPKTLGIGGLGNQIEQPYGYLDGGDWVGLCPASQSGCTEYIDPNSKFNPNLFDDRYTSPTADIRPYTLYYDGDNNISGSDILQIGSANLKYNYGDYFRSVTGDQDDDLREAVVSYHFRHDVDKTSCEGQYNFNDGCVLFNQRTIVHGGDYAPLTYNSIESEDGDSPNTSPPQDSNEIIKVQPDRACAEWLACRTYVRDEEGDHVCLDVGMCSSLDERGNCNYFIADADPERLTYPNNLNSFDIANLTGYSIVGHAGAGTYHKVPTGLFRLGDMDQIGEKTLVPNGSFEYRGDNKYPIGWHPSEEGQTWQPDHFSTIDNPVAAQNEGIEYPIGYGESFLKMSPALGEVTSEFIDVEPDTEYFLSSRVNTRNFRGGSDYGSVQAGIRINFYTGGGVHIDSLETFKEEGLGWSVMNNRFKTDGNVGLLRIELFGILSQGDNDLVCSEAERGACAGNIYFDDIKISPGLHILPFDSELETGGGDEPEPDPDPDPDPDPEGCFYNYRYYYWGWNEENYDSSQPEMGIEHFHNIDSDGNPHDTIRWVWNDEVLYFESGHPNYIDDIDSYETGGYRYTKGEEVDHFSIHNPTDYDLYDELTTWEICREPI